MGRMSLKLALAFTTVALVGVLVVALLANRLTTTEFGNYLERGGIATEQRAASQLAERYSSTGSWRGAFPTLIALSQWTGQRLVVVDGSGRVVADSSSQMMGSGSAPPPTATDRSIPLTATDGNTIGRLYFLPNQQVGMMGGMMGARGSGYQSMVDLMQEVAEPVGEPRAGIPGRRQQLPLDRRGYSRLVSAAARSPSQPADHRSRTAGGRRLRQSSRGGLLPAGEGQL